VSGNPTTVRVLPARVPVTLDAVEAGVRFVIARYPDADITEIQFGIDALEAVLSGFTRELTVGPPDAEEALAFYFDGRRIPAKMDVDLRPETVRAVLVPRPVVSVAEGVA
jgi:hypothetical protein